MSTQPKHYKNIRTMNSYSDPGYLGDDEARLIENMTPEKKSWQTRAGLAKYNTDGLPGSAGVFGLYGFTSAAGVDIALAVSNGKLYSGVAGTFTERNDDLNTTNLCSFARFGDYNLVVDQATGILAYKYGDTPFFIGISSPKITTLIDSLESTTAWSVTNGTKTANTSIFVHGLMSIDFLCNSGATMTAARTLSASVNLTAFPDGSSSSTNDYISIYILRGVASHFTNCYLDLGDSSFTNYYRYDLATHADWTGTSTSYVAFEFKVRKTSFSATGSPTWASIAAVRLVVVASGAVQPFLTVDHIRLEKSGPTAALEDVAGNLNGTYTYRVTFETVDGDKSDSSVVSNSFTVTNRKILLTNLPISGSSRIIRRNIYRIGGISQMWRFVVRLEDNTQTSYIDNTTDADLGDEFEEISGVPYIPKTICVHDQYTVIANLTTSDGISYPSGVMVSNEGSLEIFDEYNFFEIDPVEGDQIFWSLIYEGSAYVGKSGRVWKFDPKDLTQDPILVTDDYGGVGVLAYAVGEKEFFFLDKKAILMCTGTDPVDISDPVKNYIEGIPAAYISTSWMAFYNKTLYVGIPQTGDTTPTTILACYLPTGSWYVITGWAVRTVFGEKLRSGAVFRVGSTSAGTVYNALSGDTDDGTAITSTFQLPDNDYGSPKQRKDLDSLYLFGNKLTSTDATILIYPVFDFEVQSSIVTGNVVTIAGDQVVTSTPADVVTEGGIIMDDLIHNRHDIPLPPMGGFGTYLGIKLVSEKRWNFREAIIIARILDEE